MARLRKRVSNGTEYYELAWSGPDLDPATGKKNRHTRNLGRVDAVPKKLAQGALRELQRSLFIDEHGLGAPASTPLLAWAEDYLAWHELQYPSSHFRTRQILEQHVLPGWEHLAIDEVRDRDVEDKVRAWRAAGYADHTIAKHLRAARAFFNRAVEKGLLARSPAATVADPQILDSAPHVFYEVDELTSLYLAASFDPWHPNKPQHALWHAPAWKVLANTGMRRGEALHVRRAWVNDHRIQILSTDADRTKSGKWREVPMGPGAREGLAELDELLGDGREFLLPRITEPSLSRSAKNDIVRADLPGSIHSLRHTFISHLAMDPAIALRDIQIWAGHASIKTTEQYMYLRRGTELALAL